MAAALSVQNLVKCTQAAEWAWLSSSPVLNYVGMDMCCPLLWSLEVSSSCPPSGWVPTTSRLYWNSWLPEWWAILRTKGHQGCSLETPRWLPLHTELRGLKALCISLTPLCAAYLLWFSDPDTPVSPTNPRERVLLAHLVELKLLHSETVEDEFSLSQKVVFSVPDSAACT